MDVVWDKISAFFTKILYAPADIVIWLSKKLIKLLLFNADMFFLIPAILILFFTFVVGEHKYSRWAIPLFALYFFAKTVYFYYYG